MVSADPLYQFSASQIRSRIDETAETIAAQTRANAHEFVWSHFRSMEELIDVRMRAMHEFLEDYPEGVAAGRYVAASLPALPFRDDAFDLALCSHFLFLYSHQHDADFHVASLLELLRVAAEVRVFPLLELGAVVSRHLDAVIAELLKHGCDVQRVRVAYEFQRGGNEMLRVTRKAALRASSAAELEMS